MRIAILAGAGQTGWDPGNYLLQKVRFLRERGADVRVFVEFPHDLPAELQRCCQVIPEGKFEGESWEYLISADLVIAEYHQVGNLLTVLPALAGRGPRILIDYHGIACSEPDDRHYWNTIQQGKAGRGLVWNADAILVHGRFSQQELLHATGVPENRITRVAYPATPAGSDPGPTLANNRQLGEATLVLHVGRMVPEAGLPTLVEALAHLHNQRPPVHAVVICDANSFHSQEAVRCLALAEKLGVADRWHLFHPAGPEQVLAAYQSANVFVNPSPNGEGSLAVVKAMACGLPVITARAAGLPEVVGAAGLTFNPGAAADLARQIQRVQGSGKTPETASASMFEKKNACRVAVVCFRYGTDFVGGAETSMRLMAESLQGIGHPAEVFTTCTRSEGEWRNELPEGTVSINGITVHRFSMDSYDRKRHLESVRWITTCRGNIPPEIEEEYLRHTIRSSQLMEALRKRINEFDAIIVGPYLFGLTFDVAKTFPEKTLLLPCFHDEPLVRLKAWVQVYEQVGGLLYHSLEEKEFTQAVLGINHPNTAETGTWIPMNGDNSPDHAGQPRYLVYCGRYSPQKELPRLLDYARQYQQLRPGRFQFMFLGEGSIEIPKEDWATDLGFVSEERKRKILSGAAALVQLSRKESLSLVALEAWSLGVPVVADQACAVLAGHVQRSRGGRAVEDFLDFAGALDELWAQPETWKQMGQSGREYVARQYGSVEEFTARILGAIAGLTVPLAEQMKQQGPKRAAALRESWQTGFANIIENLLHNSPLPYREKVTIQLSAPACTVLAGVKEILLGIDLLNQGTHVVADRGAGQWVLRSRVLDGDGRLVTAQRENSLPRMLLPGRKEAAVVTVAMPREPGQYQLCLSVEPGNESLIHGDQSLPNIRHEATADLHIISARAEEQTTGLDGLQARHSTLAGIKQQCRLPDDYTDITTGMFARWKSWIKNKVLNNFKVGYVDRISRQQSEVNEQLLQAMHQLTDYCAALEHAVQVLQDRLVRLEQTSGSVETEPESQSIP